MIKQETQEREFRPLKLILKRLLYVWMILIFHMMELNI